MTDYSKRWRGKLPIPQHAHPLVRETFRIMNAKSSLASEVAGKAGVSPCTIYGWKEVNPSLDTFQAVLNALGFELVIREVAQ